MPAWPGGPCPDCGDEMPPKILRCRTCGATLNPSVEFPPLEAPAPVVLPELKLSLEAAPRGAFIGCPNCEKELRIANHYEGCQVQCKHCTAPFLYQRSNAAIRRIGRYLDCPHCQRELRLAEKYMGRRVACKFCDGPIQIVDPTLTESR